MIFTGLLCAAVAVLPPAAAECGCWRYVRPEGRPSDTALTGVAVPDAHAGWAVGRRGRAPFALAWNGARWRETAVPAPPGGVLEGVSASSARDAWIIASGREGTVLHWTGRRWRSGPLGGVPRAVDARTAADAWIAGGSGGRAALWRWDGARWRPAEVPALPGELVSVSARAADDAWAAGATALLHWDGRSWTEQGAGMDMGTGAGADGAELADVVALRRDEAWAVGSRAAAPHARRWDGRTWREVPVPGLRGRFDTVAGDGGSGVWAGGEDGDGRPILAHWAHGRWDLSRPPVPDPSGDDPGDGPASVAALARTPGTGRVVAAGSYGRPRDPLRHAITWTDAPRPR
ncbi:hypothetical protein ACQEU3_11530 [Spirillospora sp. CA-253888]